jgi:hypothetical protein
MQHSYIDQMNLLLETLVLLLLLRVAKNEGYLRCRLRLGRPVTIYSPHQKDLTVWWPEWR